jgi:predicted Zn finger-like uncharacterized protein
MAGSRALATRCPACGTVFRVVPDQLRVSEGWVRCGRCSEVFNAPESLVDMDTGAHQRLPEAERQTLVALPTAASAHAATPVDQPAANAPDATLQTLPPEPPRQPPLESPLESPLGPSLEPPAELPPEPPLGADTAGTLPDPRAEPDDRPPPSFVRRAEQAARWRRPWVRLALGAGAGVAALALASQVVFAYRDLAATRWPALRPALALACTALGCKLAAPRLIAGLAVQSSGLSRVDASNLYQLALTLRNQADIALALPAIDLSLTDAQGRPVSRRVLSLAEFGAVPESLAAGRELVLQATLQVAAPAVAEPVAGYTIELFYP